MKNKTSSSRLFDTKFVFVLCSILIGTTLICSGILEKSNTHIQEKDFIQLHFFALTEDGKAIPGAQVFLNDSYLGVTDSFGKWRKMIRLTLGASQTLRIYKETNRHTLRAEKVFTTPRHNQLNKDLEISAHLRLSNTSTIAKN